MVFMFFISIFIDLRYGVFGRIVANVIDPQAAG